MRVRNHGKYTNMSKNKPRAIARCDYSGLMVRHSALIKQMQYSGRGLYYTGYLVNPKFADEPNPQNLTPRIKLDPKPIPNARPDNIIDAQNTLATSIGVLTVNVGGDTDVTIALNDFINNGSFNFLGALTGNIVVYVPAIFNQFYANNLTTGDFTLGMQVLGNGSTPLIIPYASPTTRLGPLVSSTALGLQFVNF